MLLVMLTLLDEQWNAVQSLGRLAFIRCVRHTTCFAIDYSAELLRVVGEVADYCLSCSFNLEQVAVRHSGKSSMMSRERRGSCCVDRFFFFNLLHVPLLAVILHALFHIYSY